MSLLLDTHVLLWLLNGEQRRFGPRAIDALRERTAVVSAATVWEIAIKRRIGKLRGPSNLLETVTAAGLSVLAITGAHAEHVADLDDLHSDPFDRILVAQAVLEKLTIVTADARIRSYDISSLDPGQ